MKRSVHYSGTILWNSLPPNLKLIQDIDLFKKKYTDYLMSKQHNEWLYSRSEFFSDNTRVRIFIFFHYSTLSYMTKTLNQIICFSSTKIRIFFSATLGIRIYLNLGCLAIQNRVEYQKILLMYDCINNNAPDYLCNSLDMNTNCNLYLLREW
jgi:hypothetical protein